MFNCQGRRAPHPRGAGGRGGSPAAAAAAGKEPAARSRVAERGGARRPVPPRLTRPSPRRAPPRARRGRSRRCAPGPGGRGPGLGDWGALSPDLLLPSVWPPSRPELAARPARRCARPRLHAAVNGRPGGCRGGRPSPEPRPAAGARRRRALGAPRHPGEPPAPYLKHALILLGADVHPLEGQRRRLRSALCSLRLLGGHRAVPRAAGAGQCAAMRAAGRGSRTSAPARAGAGGGSWAAGGAIGPTAAEGGAGRSRATAKDVGGELSRDGGWFGLWRSGRSYERWFLVLSSRRPPGPAPVLGPSDSRASPRPPPRALPASPARPPGLTGFFQILLDPPQRPTPRRRTWAPRVRLPGPRRGRPASPLGWARVLNAERAESVTRARRAGEATGCPRSGAGVRLGLGEVLRAARLQEMARVVKGPSPTIIKLKT